MVRISLSDADWNTLKISAKHFGESVRQVVLTEARCGVEAEIQAAENGQRDGK